MSTTKHTAEPWDRGQDPSCNYYIFKTTDESTATVAATYNTKEVPAEANAARIVACVNACAGMEDPAEALRLARAALKRAAYSLKVHGAKDVDVQCAEALRALGG